MRHSHLCLAAPLALVALLGGCTVKNADNRAAASSGSGASGSGAGSSGSATGGGGSSTGTMTGTGGGGAGPGMPGWTAVPLIDDKTDPNDTVFRTGNDLVTGIYFASQDDGFVTTQGDEQTFGNGGAIFKATHTAVTSVLFSGNRDGLCLLGTIDFQGIDKSPDGYVALGYACDVIASHDGGKTFDIASASAGDQFGIERVLTMRSLGKGTLMVGDSGYLSSTDTAPGPNAIWSDVWAPTANPSVPNPVPANECQGGPSSPGVPTTRSAVHVSADGKLIAYSASPNFDPQVCISTDGGKSFFPHFLANVPADAQDFMPSGVAFANATTGIVYWANNIYPTATYIYRTTDAGQTWAPVEVPAGVVGKGIELRQAFFAPSGSRGWIVGYDYDSSTALILRTDDGGATWTRSGGDLAAKVNDAGGGKLFAGFALDDNHLWVGGERGTLMANDAGGE